MFTHLCPLVGEQAIVEGDRLDPHRLVSVLARKGRVADYVEHVDEIVRRLVSEARPGDVIAIMSNGGFDGLPDRLVSALEARAAGCA